MKKLLSSVMAIALILSMTGCAKKSNFNKLSKKCAEAAESVLDAEEADKKTRKALLKDDFEPEESEAVYFIFSEDELEDFTIDGAFEEGSLKDLFILGESEGDATIIAYVMDFKDKEEAESVFEDLYDEASAGFSKKYIKSLKERMEDLEYAYNDDRDDEFAGIFLSEESGYIMCLYYRLEGSTIIASNFKSSEIDDFDFYEEYVEFCNEAGFVDFEALMDD